MIVYGAPCQQSVGVGHLVQPRPVTSLSTSSRARLRRARPGRAPLRDASEVLPWSRPEEGEYGDLHAGSICRCVGCPPRERGVRAYEDQTATCTPSHAVV